MTGTMSRKNQAPSIVTTAFLVAAGACATISPASRIEKQLVSLGVSEARADCLADELDERLGRGDLKEVADFLEGLNRAQTPGGALDALLAIENPRAARAIASAGVACAFGS